MPKGEILSKVVYCTKLGDLSAVTVPSQHYLGSAVVDQKTNEIPVARELFKRLELEERFVSLDALHTQDETARALVSNGHQELADAIADGLVGDLGTYILFVRDEAGKALGREAEIIDPAGNRNWGIRLHSKTMLWIALNGQSVHDSCMSEDEIGAIKYELKAYKEQLDTLREDLTLLIRHSFTAQHDIQGWVNARGNPGYDQQEVERCRKFSKKYKISISWSNGKGNEFLVEKMMCTKSRSSEIQAGSLGYTAASRRWCGYAGAQAGCFWHVVGGCRRAAPTSNA
jgi:predicted transposase YbfD/YdcC